MAAGFVAPWFTAEFQEIKWVKFCNHRNPKIALDALKYVTDRLYGKAALPVEIPGLSALAESIANARKRLTP